MNDSNLTVLFCLKGIISVQYLVMGQGDGAIKHSPQDALKAWWRRQRAFISEEMGKVLREHGT